MPSVASSAPAVLIGHLADATTTLRVGAGGVMLPNHAPLVVAEQFATLEALHPGRIDLGLGRAPGTDPVTARALRRSADLGAEQLPRGRGRAHQLPGRRRRPATHPAPVPGRGYLPQVWLLGLVDLQRPAGRDARPPVQLRLPLRPGPGRPGPRALPVGLPSDRDCSTSPTPWWPSPSCAPTRRGGALAGRAVGPHRPPAAHRQPPRWSAPRRPPPTGSPTRSGRWWTRPPPTHVGGPDAVHQGWPPWSSAPVPTSSCCRPGPTPSTPGPGRSPWWPSDAGTARAAA